MPRQQALPTPRPTRPVSMPPARTLMPRAWTAQRLTPAPKTRARRCRRSQPARAMLRVRRIGRTWSVWTRRIPSDVSFVAPIAGAGLSWGSVGGALHAAMVRRRGAVAKDGLQLFPRPGDDLSHGAQLLRAAHQAPAFLAQQRHHLAHLAHGLLQLGAALTAHPVSNPSGDVVHHVAALLQHSPALVRHGVDLASVALLRRYRAHVLEQLQHRIDGAGAGGVETRRALLQLADDVIAVAGLVLQRIEDEVLEVAAAEHASDAVGRSALPSVPPSLAGGASEVAPFVHGVSPIDDISR